MPRHNSFETYSLSEKKGKFSKMYNDNKTNF